MYVIHLQTGQYMKLMFKIAVLTATMCFLGTGLSELNRFLRLRLSNAVDCTCMYASDFGAYKHRKENIKTRKQYIFF